MLASVHGSGARLPVMLQYPALGLAEGGLGWRPEACLVRAVYRLLY